jgi:hypothetical protein
MNGDHERITPYSRLKSFAGTSTRLASVWISIPRTSPICISFRYWWSSPSACPCPVITGTSGPPSPCGLHRAVVGVEVARFGLARGRGGQCRDRPVVRRFLADDRDDDGNNPRGGHGAGG